ncbi:MAG TPA: GNAT family N-acetyltransferase [Candidatus Nanopelagicaceae bacterium]
MSIRPAIISDTPAILKMIKGLAEYERAPDEVVATEDDLERTLFCENPQVYALVAISEENVVGIAIWHLNYSTWLGKHGIYLEDLYVDPKERGKGHGLALLRELAKICVDRGYERLQWWVLDWNEPSIEFYKSIGAIAMDEWTVFRLSGEALRNLSQPTSG